MQLTKSVWPVNSDGGAGHDINSPVCILMPLVNFVLKTFTNDEFVGKNGRVEI